jgi:pimeloyl-ACP methyl ester carboxylesterase
MKTPLLLLHGALGSEAQLQPLKTLLQKSGRQVFTLNFNGHGGQPLSHQAFGIDSFAHDVDNFLTNHALHNVDIFGYSMGGYVALWFAHQHPQKVSSIATLGTKFDWSPQSAEKEIRKMNPEKIAEKVPAFARLLQQRHQPHDWATLMGDTAAMMQALGEKPMLNESVLSTTKTNTLILLGDKDDMADRQYTERVATLLPKARFQLLSETPHLLEQVNLPALANILNDYFA